MVYKQRMNLVICKFKISCHILNTTEQTNTYEILNNIYYSDDLKALNTCRWVMAKQIWWTLKNDAVTYLKCWLQGYLLNVTDIYFAYKSSSGIINEPIVRKRLSDLPKEYVC